MSVFIMIVMLMSSCSTPSTETAPGSALRVPDDLDVSLWAESPAFYNPTNMDVDSKGRIWITEAVNYRNFNNDSLKHLHHASGDRVVILEDSDHDGKAETSRVFVQDKDLVSPLGIAVIGDKVIVSCSPHLIVYTDENHDDVPDKKEIFLTGFGGLDHDHSLHAVVEGPDGNWYFNTGNAGPHVVKDKSGWTLRAGSVYTGGTPYNMSNKGNMVSDDGKVWVGGLSLRIGPDGKGLKVMGHNFRNSYESAIDSYGNLWQNDNDDQVVACRTSWLMEGGNAGYFSNDGTRYWQADQRPWQDVFDAHWHQGDPAVMPAGDKSGAGAPTGIAFYEGDELGEKYRGTLLSADAGRNMVFGYHPTPDQSGYDLGKPSSFITSLPSDNPGYVWNDSAQNARQEKWFRPSDVVVGADGAIYVADWYDPVVGGHQMQDSTGYGRIYRIAPKGKKLEMPRIEFESWVGLIRAFQNPAIHVRGEAFNRIVVRGEAGVGPVKEFLENQNPFIRARAVWLLSRLGAAGRAEVEQLLADNDPQIRATAYRALRQLVSDIVPLATQLVHDSSSFVRREVAISLRDVSWDKKSALLTTLARQTPDHDRWYTATIASACAGHEEEMIRALKADQIVAADSRKWSARASALTFALHPASAVSDFVKRATDSLISKSERTHAVTALSFINTKQAVDAMVGLSATTDKFISEQAKYWASFRQSNDWYSLVDWSKTGLDPEYERNVASMQVKLKKILDVSLPFDEKKWNATDMAKDVIGGQMLLAAVSEHKISNELYPAIADVIFKNPDTSVRIQATGYFMKPGGSKSYSIPEITLLQPEVSAGRMLFEKNCTLCHRAGETGKDIGPDLSAIGQKFDQRAILDAVINPNSGIVFGYEPWLVTTKSGVSYYGFLIADGEKLMTIKDLSGRKHTIPTSSVQTKRKQENSIMPEASAFSFSEQDLADLSGYLLTLKTQ